MAFYRLLFIALFIGNLHIHLYSSGVLTSVCPQLIRLLNYYVKHGYADLPHFSASEIKCIIECLYCAQVFIFLLFSFSSFVYASTIFMLNKEINKLSCNRDTALKRQNYTHECIHENIHKDKRKQESCAIAKMTAQCTLYMGALKIFGTP